MACDRRRQREPGAPVSRPSADYVLRFDVLGEPASRRFLAGWCGPLVPECPTAGHDHEKLSLSFMDCSGAQVLEGYVLTFITRSWSHETQLVFERATPPGSKAEDLQAGRRVFDWPTTWRWLSATGEGCGLDLTRPEVWTRACELLAQAFGAKPALGEGWTLRWDGTREGWVLEALAPAVPAEPFRAVWDLDGKGWSCARGEHVGALPEGRQHGPAVLIRLLLAARDRIAALPLEVTDAARR